MNQLESLATMMPPWLLVTVGVFAGWLKTFWSWIYDHTAGYVLRKLHVSLSIEDTEHLQAYKWMTLWAEKRLREKRISAMLLRKAPGSDQPESAYILIPDYGTYYFRWQRCLMVLSHTKSGGDGSPSESIAGRKITHTVTISLWGTLDRGMLLDVLTEAAQGYAAQHPEALYYYTNSTMLDCWEGFHFKRRSLETVFFDRDLIDDILDDFQKFFGAKDKYTQLGIPWRRGWLLHGPPGTGKSSLVQVLASLFNTPIYYLSLNAILSARELTRLFSEVDSPAIVLIEDADCLQIAGDRNVKSENKDPLNQLVLSDVLNVLDGLVATEGRLVIMTTNDQTKLDAALLRAGRIDRKFYIGYPGEEQLRAFHRAATQVFPLPEFKEFLQHLPRACTIAEAQALMFKLQIPQETVANQ